MKQELTMCHLSHGLHDLSKIREGYKRDIYSFFEECLTPHCNVNWTYVTAFRMLGQEWAPQGQFLMNVVKKWVAQWDFAPSKLVIWLWSLTALPTLTYMIHRGPPSYMSSQLLCGMIDAHPVTFCWGPHFSPAISFPSILMTPVSPNTVAQIPSSNNSASLTRLSLLGMNGLGICQSSNESSCTSKPPHCLYYGRRAKKQPMFILQQEKQWLSSV